MKNFPAPVKRNQVLTAPITDYGFEGVGITKISGTEGEPPFAVLIPHSFPGDIVEFEIIKVRSSYAEAKLLNVVHPSADRVPALCSHYGVCGGCKQQDLLYAQQLAYKEKQTHEILRRIGKITGYTADTAMGCDHAYYYRNKMEFSFTPKRWLTVEEIGSGIQFTEPFALGFHLPGVFDKAITVNRCFLQSEESNIILNLTRDFFLKKNSPAFNIKTGEGYLKNLVIREGKKTGERMINLVTGYDDARLMEEYTETVLKTAPATTTIINNISARKSNVAVGETEKVYHGTGTITDTIGSMKFRISANSFFQTNTVQAEHLYNRVLLYAELTGKETVYDLYCGAGTITCFLAQKAGKVFGFEVAESSVADAGYNAELNNLQNIAFYRTDLLKPLYPEIIKNGLPSPDVVVLDPPRAGLHANTISDVLTLNVPLVVYVSCNPATLARDLDLLKSSYMVERLTPVDMFPQTYHIEVVAQLRRREG